LDGLADCLDGLAGRDRTDRLAIMRDSRIGVFGAVGLILYFLASLLALAELPAGSRGRILLLAPVAGRLAPLVIGPRFSPATSERGLGGQFLSSLSGWAGPVNLVGTLALGSWLFGPYGVAMALGSLLVAFAWSAFLARRLGGLTGDVLGSGVELCELAVLIGASSLAQLRLI
jgi:adenosylcobinamide-GDP ribazoletransferase